MNRIPSVLATVLLCVTAASCAKFGTPYDPAVVATLQPGMAEAEVIQRLGAPNAVSTWGNGQKVMTWSYSEANGLTGKSSARSVGIVFGPDGRMIRPVIETNTQGSF